MWMVCLYTLHPSFLTALGLFADQERAHTYYNYHKNTAISKDLEADNMYLPLNLPCSSYA